MNGNYISHRATGRKKNVVVLISHDTGQYISPYGIDTVHTPNFERLSKTSLLFTNAFSCSPQCSPARAALFSGQYPHSVGVMGNIGEEHGWCFPETQRHAGRIFQDSGYETWLLGLQHETWRDVHGLGFDEVQVGFPIADAAEHIEQLLAKKDPNKPFYCQIGCHETHRPYSRFGAVADSSHGVFLPENPIDGAVLEHDMAAFQGAVRVLDTGVGRILDTLESYCLMDNTIVVITSDHGIAIPRAKATLYDPGLEVFLMMHDPEYTSSYNARYDGLISHVDVLPTILELCGLQTEKQMQGVSHKSVIDGSSKTVLRNQVFSEKSFFHQYDPMRSVRTERFRYIQNFELQRHLEIPSDFLNSVDNRLDYSSPYMKGHPQDELYDVIDDPGQINNLAKDPDFISIVAVMKKTLLEWMKETCDPLLEGHITSPYHARVVKTLLDAK